MGNWRKVIDELCSINLGNPVLVRYAKIQGLILLSLEEITEIGGEVFIIPGYTIRHSIQSQRNNIEVKDL